MKFYHGYIDKHGNVISSGGPEHIHVKKITTGIYEISFKPHFRNVPAIVATQVYKDNSPLGGSTLDNVVITELDKHSVKFKTGDSTGNAQDRDFTFVALGE